MPRPANFGLPVFFASLLSALLLFLFLVSNAPSRAEIPVPARPAAPSGVSSVIWGEDICLTCGGQYNAPSSDDEVYVRRKNHVMDIDPTNPNHLTASYVKIDFKFDSYYANSTNGGLTWATGVFTDLNGMFSGGDANIVFDGHGVSYYTMLAISNTTDSLLVYTSTNGLSWNAPVEIITYSHNESRYFSTLAADKRTSGSNAGSLYLFYQFTDSTEPFFRGVRGKYSRDGGRTWSADVQVTDANHYYAYGPSTDVASDGSIYVAFEHRPDNIIFNSPELYLDRSTDGGLTWGADRLISGAPIHNVGSPDWKDRELTLSVPLTDTCHLLRINHYPSIAVSPANPNTVYATWNDSRWDTEFTGCGPGTGTHGDIAFSRTTDGGLTWTAPVRINDDPAGNGVDQFMPTIQVAPNGTIGVTWYDRRYDPLHAFYDLAYTESTDGGATWSANQRVSDVSSNADNLQDVKGINDMGYLKALVYGPDFAIASWLDTRLVPQQGDFFIDRGVITGTATPTLTATATRTPTRTSTVTVTRTNTSTVATSTRTATPAGCALQFEDVPEGHTFYTFVRCLACQGFLSGYPCGGAGEPCLPPNNYPYFRPSANITRGQLSKVVSNAAGFNEPVSGQTFEDILPGSTFYDFIERLASRSIIGGYYCGGAGEPCVPPDHRPYFRPNANSTRGQISKIVAVARGYQDPTANQTFEDVPVGSTFHLWIENLASRGIMNGYVCGGSGEPCVPPSNRPYFRPGNNATRGQVSKIVANTFFPECNP